MSCGGLVVEIEHGFPRPVRFRGSNGGNEFEHPVHRWYSRYEHLNSTLVYEGQQVDENEQIALVGTSGTCADANTPKLHFEVILSNSNLQSNYDARVHPFLAFPRGNLLHWKPLMIQPEQSIIGPHADGIIEIQTRNIQPDVFKIIVQILRQSDGRAQSTHTIDFNKREGFLLSTPETSYPNMMYTPIPSIPHLLPAYFDRYKAIWSATLVIPSTWVSNVPVFLTSGGVPEPQVFKVSLMDTQRRRYTLTGPVTPMPA